MRAEGGGEHRAAQQARRPHRVLWPRSWCTPVTPGSRTRRWVPPAGSRRRPGASQPSPGFMCFRKAASATCPFPTPTQVGDSDNPPGSELGARGRAWGGGEAIGSPWGRGRAQHSPEALCRDTPSPRCSRGNRFPYLCGKRDQRGLVSFPHQELALLLPCSPVLGRPSRPHGLSRLPLCSDSGRCPCVWVRT